MITYIKGDLLTVTNGMIIHGCNCSGGFGSGIAGQIRKKWPSVYEEFKLMPLGEVSLGKIQINNVEYLELSDLWVVNCFTQLNYGADGKKYASVDAIKNALVQVFERATVYRETIHSPKIGCGLGGLDWETEVRPIFEDLNNIYPNVNICIYEL